MINLLLNLILFTGKFIAGKISGSVSITADAFNNLTDAGTVCLAALGIKVSHLGPGKRHPNGHGKFEWIIALITSLSVFLVGWELFRDSIKAISHPSDTVFSWLTLIILIISISIKFFLYIYNNNKSKDQNSLSLKAIATDSLSDAISTAAVLISLLLNTWFGWKLDGIFGLGVSFVIMFNAIKSFSDSIEQLMGRAACKEDIDNLKNTVKSICPQIKNVYDIEIDDYGNNHKKALFSILPDNRNETANFNECIPILSSEIKKRLNYDCVIQTEYPINQDDENHIIDKVKSNIKSAGYSILLMDTRILKFNNNKQLRSIAYIQWDKKYNKDEIEKFLNSPVSIGLDKNDSIIIDIRMGDYNMINSDTQHRHNHRKHYREKNVEQNIK